MQNGNGHRGPQLYAPPPPISFERFMPQQSQPVAAPSPQLRMRGPVVARGSKPTVPLQSDAEWLKEHAFWFTKAGRLDSRKRHAEPAYMCERCAVVYPRWHWPEHKTLDAFVCDTCKGAK